MVFPLILATLFLVSLDVPVVSCAAVSPAIAVFSCYFVIAGAPALTRISAFATVPAVAEASSASSASNFYSVTLLS
jgi:hypothetical protein